MSSPVVDTKSLFATLLKRLDCDLVLDIGSRDGRQALLFRDLRPQAPVVAFEANPYNYRKMAANPVFAARHVTLCPLAVSQTDGTATFHISRADYDAPETDANNLGTSSLLVHPEVSTLAAVEVQTVRLETFLRQPNFASCQRIALWIDVEGAEYFVLEGLGDAVRRVPLIHVETARESVRIGQKARPEVSRLLSGKGFVEIGTNMTSDAVWGDLVWVAQAAADRHPSIMRAAVRRARWNHCLRLNSLAVTLKRAPWLYRALRWLFVRGV